MRRLWYILSLLVTAFLLCGCSAQRRLECLLRHHPELRSGTVIANLKVDVPVPYEAASVDIPWLALFPDSLMGSAAENRKSDTTDIGTVPTFPITVRAGHAKATLCKTDSGLVLTAEQLSDTIQAEVPAEVPIVDVHDLPAEEKPINTFFRYLGYMVAGLIGVVLVVLIIKAFI